MNKFNGHEFAIWKFRMEAYLDYPDLLAVVDGSEAKPTEAGKIPAWEKTDKKARLVIGQALVTNVVRQIMSLKTKAEMWARLSSLYELKSATSVHLLLQKFYDYKMNPEDTVGQHVANVEEMARQLEDLDQKQTDLALVTKVIMSLPSSFRHLISAWDSVPVKEQTMANLLPRLQKEEMLSKSMAGLSDDDTEPAALYHKSGQFKKKPASQQHDKKFSGPSKKEKFKGKCFHCNATGHRKADCFKLKAAQKEGHANTASTSGSLLTATAGRCMAMSSNENIWLADSGASQHMTSHREWFTEFTPIARGELAVTVGNNEVVYALGRGNVPVEADVGQDVLRHSLTNVLYLPGIGRKLFSLGASADKNVNAIIGRADIKLMRNGQMVANGVRVSDGLYRLNIIATNVGQAYIASASAQPLQVWHERFCHVNFKTMRELAKGDAVDGLKCTDLESCGHGDQQFCEACVFGKQTRKPFHTSEKWAEKPGDLIHFDVCGPMSVDALCGSKVMALFVDDCTGCLIAFPMKSCSEIVAKLQEVLAMANADGHKVKRVRSDNAKEFVSAEMKNFCRVSQVVHDHSAPYCPEQMGRVERQNRTVIEMARSMLVGANLLSLWGEAVKAAAQIRNRVPLARLDGKTPYETWTGQKPDVSLLRIYGSRSYLQIDEQHRKKLDPKSKAMVLVGYEFGSKSYRLWEPGTRKVVIGHDVEVYELPPKQLATLITPTDETGQVPVTDETVGDCVARHTRSKERQSKTVASVQLLVAETTPVTIEEAKSGQASKQLEAAMNDELDSLAKNETWIMTDLPPGRKAIKNKWVFRIKAKADGSIDRFKARLVVKGCSQKAGQDYSETYAPVARFDSVRILLAIAAAKDFDLKQFDVKTAFLHGDLDEDIYMAKPDGFDDGSEKVCHLKKSFYGLKQAPRQWHAKFDGFLQQFGLTPSKYDPCIYTSEDGLLMLALSVDDGLVMGQSVARIDELLAVLKSEIEVTDSVADCYLVMVHGIHANRSW